MSQNKQAQEKQRQQRQKDKAKAEAQQHKQIMMPLVKYMKKHGVKFRHASVMGNRIQYFRVDEYEQLLQKKKSDIQKNEVLKNILKTYNDQFIYFRRPDPNDKRRYPPNLQPVRQKNKFASFRFDTTQSHNWKFLSLVFGILFIVLFPIWPYQLKYAIWLISLILLIFLVSLIVLRLIIYLICVVFGISMWIFPNLLGQYGVIESFRPFYTIQKWQISIWSIILRLGAITLFAYYGYHIYNDPSFLFGTQLKYVDYFETTKSTVNDIHDWGISKIKGQGQNFSQRALTNLEMILNETSDVADINETIINSQTL